MRCARGRARCADRASRPGALARSFQIDNQLPNPDFPVVLHQVVVQNRKNAEGKEVEQQLLHLAFRRCACGPTAARRGRG